MAVITISRGSYSKGVEIAEKVSHKLKYNCISRESLLESSEEFNTPDMRLIHSLEDIPSIFKRFRYGTDTYVSKIRALILRNLKNDKTVYHGFAGHHFVKNISNVFKVRILANQEHRIKFVMERDKISREDAAAFIDKIDEQRRNWSRYLYGIDIRDAGQFDLTLNLDKISTDDAIETICHLTESEQLKTTSESQREIDNMSLESEVRLVLPDLGHNIEISANEGKVTLKGFVSAENDIAKYIEATNAVTGVETVYNEIECLPKKVTAWSLE